MLRERVPPLPDFAAPPVDDFFGAEDLRPPPLRDAPELEDFALLERDFAPPVFAPDEVERAPGDFARELDDFAREPLDLRALPLPRLDPDDELEPPELPLALPSIDHLPVMTR